MSKQEIDPWLIELVGDRAQEVTAYAKRRGVRWAVAVRELVARGLDWEITNSGGMEL